MTILYSGTQRQRVAYLLLIAMGINILAPSASYGLTGGPSQPEFSSFEPVSTNQMVDEFTGDFTYNIPVLNVPGPNGSDYPLSLSYHSGASPEEEASWVGYGWTLNAGAITRNTRGFPDDYSGQTVTYWNKAPKNWTATIGAGVSSELFGKDFLSRNLNASLRYNSYMGYGYNVGFGIALGKGLASVGYNATDGRGSFSASVNPKGFLTQTKQHAAKSESASNNAYNKPSATLKAMQKFAGKSSISILGGNFGLLSFSEAVRANHVTAYNGAAFNLSVNMQINPAVFPYGPTYNVNGSYSYQSNVEQSNAPAFGYMYTSEAYYPNIGQFNARRNPDAVEDYYVEKDAPYNKRDTYLGIPINNADLFSVSGEGIGGSFRLYHKQVGEFTPNSVTSTTTIANISPELSLGLTFGAGIDAGAGWQTLTEGEWHKNPTRFSAASSNGNENTFFRFTNDLGGTWASTAFDDPVQATARRSGYGSGSIPSNNPASTREGRSSYISYHTKEDVASKRRFSQRPDNATIPTNRADLSAKAICEMSVVTATGGTYIYGLPVLNKNEKNLHYGVVNEPSQNVVNNYLVYSNKSDREMSAISGEVRNEPYAGSFLLTETRTPDYVDRTFDGPTPDDFGGYTRFNYSKQWGGGTPSWYNWRIPYTGLLYRANSLSDPLDDIGSVSCGQKEIATLHSIQTKTHTAIFTLASTPRIDGYDALPEAEVGGPRSVNYKNSPVTGRHGLYELKKIDLYNNSDIVVMADGYPKAIDGAKPIKTVHFEYDKTTGTLSEGVPNTDGQSGGKLTLKRIYFEYQGVATQISPYTFSYAYPDFNKYPSKYQAGGINNVTAGFNTSATLQNPDYTPYNLDAWGNYQAGGAARFSKQKSWVDQKTNSTFDPAAWQLKVITLPTGGQIHVQYEQDDYAYVQDKPAHVMVPLLTSDNELPAKFVLDLRDVGITENADILATKEAVDREYVDRSGRKIYFKFLYSLIGSTAPSIDPISCNSEYITGYTTVHHTAIEGTNLVLYLHPGNGFFSSGDYKIPKQVCQNFASTQRNGKLNAPGICDPSVNGISDQGFSPAGLMRFILQRLGSVVGLTNSCAALSAPNSYFRIPVIKAKKGGGLRVKRLLTFDNGYDDEAVLYGSEYLYQTTDPATGRLISSGVATTEPGGQREENILVDFMPRENQNLWSKIVAGEDMKQAEGPLGEGLLPAPLVGYSRVVTRNIHSGRTTTGYSVSEFATTRQYPMQVKASAIQSDNEYRLITAGLITDQVNNLYASQGYSFLLNNMNGQILRKATYPGGYVSQEAEEHAAPSSEQEYTYFEPGKVIADVMKPADDVPVVSAAGMEPRPSHPGREVDLTVAQRSVKDTMYDLNYETDVDVTFLVLFSLGYWTFFPTLTRSSADFSTHATSKVIRYPAIVKKIKTLQDGIVHVSENLAFDQYTGQPVIVQTNDEFAGGYLQQTQMASWLYPRFGAKANNEGLELSSTAAAGIGNISAEHQKVYLTMSGAACDGLAKLTRGDLVELTNSPVSSLANMVFHVDQPDLVAKRVRVYPITLPSSSAASFQSVNSTFPAIASPANPLTINKLRIIASGRTNQLTTVAGSTTYHNKILGNRSALASQVPIYGANDGFTLALNTALSGINPTPGSTPTSYDITGVFNSMNVSAFANLISPELGINPSNVTIQHVKVLAVTEATGQRRIMLDQFEIVPLTGPPVLIKNP